MEISAKWLYFLLTVILGCFGYIFWLAFDNYRNTNYTLRCGWEVYDIKSIVERTPNRLKAIKANGESIEVNGQYTLIGPYGDK